MNDLPPSALSPAASEAVAAVAGGNDQPSPSTRHYGTVVGGSAGAGWTVHLFADPDGHNITCASDLTGIVNGSIVTVGFFDDLSIAIVAVSA